MSQYQPYPSYKDSGGEGFARFVETSSEFEGEGIGFNHEHLKSRAWCFDKVIRHPVVRRLEKRPAQ